MNFRLHITVYGIVQGVFFRANACDVANSLGLTGWVRNKPDATVEILAEGAKEKLEELLKWCRKGPNGASVEKVESDWLEYKGEFKEFKIIY